MFQSYRHIFFPLISLIIIWVVYWIEIRFGLNFNQFGVFPRTFKGFRGVLFSPFIHSGIEHLYKNSIPLVILSAALAYFYPKNYFRIFIYGFFMSGLLSWIIARPSYHIGASGVVYFLASFLFFNGIRSKNYRLIALALTVAFVYGSLVWGVLPDQTKKNISWEGHLSGLIAGFLLSYFHKSEFVHKDDKLKKIQSRPMSEKEKEFLAQFDEDGNFNPIEPEEKTTVDVDLTSEDYQRIEVFYKPKKED